MEKYHSNLVRLMVKIACIFAIPAFGGFFVGLFLDRYFGTERRYILMTLGFCFVLSWVLLWRMYAKMKRAEGMPNMKPAEKIQLPPTSGEMRYNEPGVWQSKRK